MKSVLRHVRDDAGLEARTQAALDIMRSNGGHLASLQAIPPSAYVSFDTFDGIFVMNGVVQGDPNKTITYDLGISPRTVEIYRANLMAKLRVRSLSEALRTAFTAETAPVPDAAT